MRISFGGRGPGFHFYMPLGPIGNIAMGAMITFVGAVVALTGFGSIVTLAIGILFIVLGIGSIRKGTKMIKTKHDNLD